MTKKFKASFDLVNIGLWLHENGFFEERKGLLVYWLFLAVLSFAM
jgi:hypothetical protein